MPQSNRFLDPMDHTPVPRLPAPVPAPGNFMAFPPGVLQNWQIALYQQAYALAQEIARPSLLERDLAGVWN
jgi:hypothetical protein